VVALTKSVPGGLAVMDKDGIHLFDTNYSFSKTLGPNVTGKCRGLAEDEFGQLVSVKLLRRKGESMDNIFAFVIYVEPITENVVKTVPVPRSPPAGPPSNWSITIAKESLYLLDQWRNCVYVVSADAGQLRHTISNPLGEPDSWRGLAVNQEGSKIFISDCTHIKVMSQSGEYLGRVDTGKDETRAAGLHWDPKQGLLYVANRMNRDTNISSTTW